MTKETIKKYQAMKPKYKIPHKTATGREFHEYWFSESECEDAIKRFQIQLTEPMPESVKSYHTETSWNENLQKGLEYYTTYWRSPIAFEDTLEVIGYNKGRSSMVMEMKSMNTGDVFSMFISDWWEMYSENDMPDRKITGFFIPCKKGSNFGLKFIGK